MGGFAGGLPKKPSAPKLPRDLFFGALLTDHILSPSSPLFKPLTFTSQMRHLDTLNAHPLPPSEAAAYNLPGTRIATASLSSLLALSGAGKGARFTTEELREAGRIAGEMEEAYGRVDGAFKALSTAEKKLTGSDLSLPLPLPLPPSPSPASAFLSARDSYLSVYALAASLVSSKRSSLAARGPVDVEVDPEAEMKLAAPLPLYLTALIEKYATSQEVKPLALRLDSLSRFSSYLAASITGEQILSTPSERAALDLLVSASDDLSGEEGAQRTERYWRERVFGFLGKMREVKAVPKKEGKLHDRQEWK